MAITTTVGTPTLCPNLTTTNFTFDAGTAPKALVVTCPGAYRRNHPTSISYNGVALTNRSNASYGTLADIVASVWVLENPASGSNTLSVVVPEGYHLGGIDGDIMATPYALTSNRQVVYSSEESDTSSIGTKTVTLDAGADEGVILMAFASNNAGSVGDPTGTNFVEDYEGYVASADQLASGHQSVSSTGNRTVGWTSSDLKTARAAVMMVEDVIEASPDPVAIEVTMPAPGILGPGDVFAYPEPAKMEVVMPAPRLDVRAPMVVPLVGEHTETPGRVPRPAGMTTPVLTQQNGKYVWVEFDTLVTQRTRLVPLTTINASGDPELVWDDNGDLIYTEYYE